MSNHSTTRVFPEPGEKPSAIHHLHSPSGSRDRLWKRSGFPVSGSVSQHNDLNISDSLPQVGPSASPVSVARENDLVHFDSPVGSFSCLTVATVPAPVPEDLSQQLQNPGTASGGGPPVILLVDLGGLKEGMHFPRTTMYHHDNRCKLGLGHTSSLPRSSRSLVSSRSPEQYQLAGPAGSPPCPVPLPVRRGKPPIARPDRQRDHESTCEP